MIIQGIRPAVIDSLDIFLFQWLWGYSRLLKLLLDLLLITEAVQADSSFVHVGEPLVLLQELLDLLVLHEGVRV